MDRGRVGGGEVVLQEFCLAAGEDAAEVGEEDGGVEVDGKGERGGGGVEGGGGWQAGAIGVEGEGSVVHGGVVVDERDGEGRDGGAEAVGDDAGEEVAEGMRCIGLALLQGVGLEVGM